MRTVQLSKEGTARRNTAFLAAEHDREAHCAYNAAVVAAERGEV